MYLLTEYSNYKDLISNLAVITTIFQFLSGILVCLQYVANKTTGDASSLPFLGGALSAALWMFYGIIKHDDKIVMVNTIGVTCMMAYLLVFYKYTIKKSTLLKLISAGAVAILIVLCYAVNEKDYEILMCVLGMAASFSTLLTVGAPLTQLFHVIRVGNTACLPFPMILMSFLVTTLWMLYGLTIIDYYIIVPNLIGAVLAALQLSLFIIYPFKLSTPNKTQIA